MSEAGKLPNIKLVTVTVSYGLVLAVITIFLYHVLAQREIISAGTTFVVTVTTQILFMIAAQIHTLRLGNTNIIKLFLVGICCFMMGETLWQLLDTSLNENRTLLHGLNAMLKYSLQYSSIVAISAGVQILYIKISTHLKRKQEL